MINSNFIYSLVKTKQLQLGLYKSKERKEIG
jgi:hypothetical protein